MLPAGPVAGQFYQRFPLFSSVLEQILELVPKILFALYVSHAAVTKIFAKTQPSQSDQKS